MARKRGNIAPSEMLFAGDQQHLFEKSYEEKIQAEKNKPLECLGMTFPNDEERRKYFLVKLREKLKDPESRIPFRSNATALGKRGQIVDAVRTHPIRGKAGKCWKGLDRS